MAKKYLTLNIGAANVELAEYETSAKGALTLLNYGTARLAASLDGGDVETILSSALQEIMQASGIRPGPVAVSISGQLAFPRLATIPAAGGDEKFEQMVRYEVEQNIPFPIDEMVCDRQVLGDTENGDKSVLIVAAKIDQVEAITSAVASVGFTPELVDIAPLALVNALYHARPDEAEQVKLERGYVSTGGVTEDEDEVADRVSKVCRAVLTRLNAELTRSINFYRSQQGGGTPVKLYLTGGTALLPQIDQFFSASLGIPTEFFNPFETIAIGPKVNAEALESDGALVSSTAGLALHLAGLSRFAINLLPPSLVEARAEKAKIPFVVVGGVALVAALALTAVSVNRQAAMVEEKRDAVQNDLNRLRAEDKRITAAQKALTVQEQKAAALGSLFEKRTAALRRLGAVCKALEGRPGAWIDRWDASGVTVRQWKDKAREQGGKTTAESIAGAIGSNDTNVIDRASVKITSMSELGKGAQVKQFTVEFKCK